MTAKPYWVRLHFQILAPKGIKKRRDKVRELDTEIPVYDLDRAITMMDHFAKRLAESFQEAEDGKEEYGPTGRVSEGGREIAWPAGANHPGNDQPGDGHGDGVAGVEPEGHTGDSIRGLVENLQGNKESEG